MQKHRALSFALTVVSFDTTVNKIISFETAMFGSRLKEIREYKRLSQKDFSDFLGVSINISDAESGKKIPKSDFLASLKRAMPEIDLNWLLTGQGEMMGHTEESNRNVARIGAHGDYIYVPKYGVLASAGGGSLVYRDQVVDYMAFKPEYLRTHLGMSPDHSAVISVIGDSMEPYLFNGDLILVDTQVDHVVNNAVYVLQNDGALLVKRIQKKVDGTVIVKSDNKAYDPEVFTGDSAAAQLRIVGRVVRRLVR